jgi:hypothetical protein
MARVRPSPSQLAAMIEAIEGALLANNSFDRLLAKSAAGP